MAGASKATVLKLLIEVGEFCSFYQNQVIRGLSAVRVEADEIWAFVGANHRRARREVDGDIWTYTAIDADSKLMITWLVGARTPENATEFMLDLAGRLANPIQLTTDGHPMYRPALERAFGSGGTAYAMLVKTYGQPETAVDSSWRYSPPASTGAQKEWGMGKPDETVVPPSYVDSANLSIRSQRWFTRLTNAFSKKAENHAHAVSFYFMYYNFCRLHQTHTKARKGVHVAPAMAAGLTDHIWKVEDILARLDPRVSLQAN